MNVMLNTAKHNLSNYTKLCIFRNLSSVVRSSSVVNLAYSEYSEHCISSDKPPVLIAHGFLGSKNNWHSMARALNKSTKHKVITIDIRGHGESPHALPYDYNTLSEDIIQFIKAQGIPKAIIIGHSMGGRTAAFASLKQPELVAGLVVVDISPFSTPSNNPTSSYLEAMGKVRWDPQVSLSEVRKMVDKQLSHTIPDVMMRQFLATNLVKDENGVRWKCDLLNFINRSTDIQNPCMMTGDYNGRTLFVGGGKSPYIPKEDHAAIRGLFPNVQFEYIPGASHFVHADKPREFLECATAFINQS